MRRLPVAHRRARTVRIAIGGLAAAASLLLAVNVLRQRTVAPDAERLRHATIEVAAAPRLLGPAGAIAHVDTLRWTALPGADRYRVTVFDENGAVAWESESADTFAVVPAVATAQWRGRHGWRVKARTSFDRWVDSDFGEFTVNGGVR